MNFRFLYNKYNGLYEGIVRPPFPENSTEIEPYFDFACKTIYDFQKGTWKLVSREEFYAQMVDVEKLNDIDLKCFDKLDLVHHHLLQIGHSVEDEIVDLGLHIKDSNKNIIFDYNIIANRLIDMNDKIDDLRHDNDLISHNVEHELKFVKSQINYLIGIIERPSLWTRFVKLIFFWR